MSIGMKRYSVVLYDYPTKDILFTTNDKNKAMKVYWKNSAKQTYRGVKLCVHEWDLLSHAVKEIGEILNLGYVISKLIEFNENDKDSMIEAIKTTQSAWFEFVSKSGSWLAVKGLPIIERKKSKVNPDIEIVRIDFSVLNDMEVVK